MEKVNKKSLRMMICHILDNDNPNYDEIQRLITILENKPNRLKTRVRNKVRVLVPYKEYAKCFDEGMSAREIMTKFNCGENTVYTHKRTWRKEKEDGQKNKESHPSKNF